jgi:outer membrane immunogenic protein
MSLRAIIVAGLAAVSALVMPASAADADLGWGGAASAPAQMFSPTSASNWTGFYVGATGGYAFGAVRQTPPGLATTETNASGWLAGAHAGYNFDFGGFVLGGEADIAWTNFGYERDVGAPGRLRANLDAFGTARLRAGATFGPVMPYFTGGIAMGHGNVSTTTPAGVTTSQGNNHFGWTLGGGLEAQATENITLRAEYLYVDLGSASYNTAPGGVSDFSHRFSVIRAGVSYKF